MSNDPQDGGSGGGAQTRGDRIVAWLNHWDNNFIPPQINGLRNGQGLISLKTFQNMNEVMRQRIIEAFDRRDDGGAPFPHYYNGDIHDSGGQGPGGGGGPGGGPGGGGPHPGGNGPGGGNPGPGGGNNRSPHDVQQEALAEYGFSMAFLNHHPELKRLFNQAVQGSWSPTRFVAELRDTHWFQNNSASARQFSVNRITDPASWQADLDRTTAHIRQVYGQTFGIPLNQHLAGKWAMRAMRFGWTDEQINDHLVSSINFRKLLHNDTMGGSAAQTANQMKQMAGDYGVDPSNHWYARRMEQVLKGNDTMDGVLNQLRERAKNKYDAFADQIDQGKTMREIADPYVQSMAQLLEMNPGQIDLGTRMISKALTRRVDGKTQPLSIGDFEDSVRQDPRWMKTQQANDQFAQTAYGLLTSWGLV